MRKEERVDREIGRRRVITRKRFSDESEREEGSIGHSYGHGSSSCGN